MVRFELTPAQKDAAEFVGRSVAVSAAAGSGKTSVLAKRCTYLVCDAPPDRRCEADQLLVLTFTDAAAAEMRERITDSIRERAERDRGDARLRRQVALVSVARISTVHSFCAWVVRRWFNEAGVDPAFSMLDAPESAMIRREVLDGLFAELYAARPADTAADSLSREADSQSPWDPPLARSFVRLVDDYGLGQDETIAKFVLKLAGFVDSLPEPDRWLDEAISSVRDRPEAVCLDRAAALAREIGWQIEHARRIAERIRDLHPLCVEYADRAEGHADALRGFADTLGLDGDAGADSEDAAGWQASFESVRRAMGEYDVTGKRMKSLPKGADDEAKSAKDEAKRLWDEVKKRFKDRIQTAHCRFSIDEWLSGMARTAPYVETLVETARMFRARHAARKQRMGVLDFSDLERFAFQVLHAEGEADTPSPVARSIQNRFEYVLVDEFQDINPLQEAILRLVSRESDPQRDDNLFVVGDVKQSIYGFRLAEPAMFRQRFDAFADDPHAGHAVFLSDNFRSQPVILDAANAVFRAVMRRELGDIAYDNKAELTRGRDMEPGEPQPPVELHLLDRDFGSAHGDEGGDDERADDGADAEEASGASRGLDPSKWSAVEREAHLIASKIRSLVDSPGGEGVAPASSRWSHRQDAGATQAGATQAGATQAGATQAGATQAGATQAGATQAGATQAGATQAGATQAGAACADATFSASGYAYRDCAVLLRGTKVNAGQVADMLTRMGVPAYADAAGSLFDCMEVRDLIAALELLDNPKQDIPLASVLRSGVFCEPRTEDELLEIRCLDRRAPFHEVVRRYAQEGEDVALRERLGIFRQTVARLREAVRRRPLAEAVWRILHERDFLAYAGGLPGGPRRRANLLKMHDLARQFGTMRRQGLHRFLRFIEWMRERGESLPAATEGGESQDVVRVMSIHKSKGLEFPVVFVAGLGTKFNLGDRKGRMILGRTSGVGLRVVDAEVMIEYPTAAHQRVADEVEHHTRAEELRILYVAMTRARDRLVLMGSMKGAERIGADVRIGGAVPTTLQLAAAATALDWLIPAIESAPTGQVAWPGQPGSEKTIFDVRVHSTEEMARWKVGGASSESRGDWSAAAVCGPLPDDEPRAPDDPRVEGILEAIEYRYPSLAVTSIRATVAASAFAGRHDYFNDPEMRPDTPRGVEAFEIPPSKYAPTVMDAAARGTATHRVLQHLDFTVAVDEDGVASELQRIQAEGVASQAEIDAVDRAALAWFAGTSLAASIRGAGDRFRREFLFVSAEPCATFDEMIDAAEDQTVLVRGIVDGIIDGGKGLEILDYKTDGITDAMVEDRCARYRPQLQLYARAVERLWRKPVRRSWLVFLTPRRIVGV